MENDIMKVLLTEEQIRQRVRELGQELTRDYEGKDPVMVGIMANVASAQNIRQFGVIPDFATARREAVAQAEALYKQYMETHTL